MLKRAVSLGIATAVLLATAACNKSNESNRNGPPEAQTKKAQKIAGTKTIAAGLSPTIRFMVAAKAAGLDQTLAGPGPYTVFVPDDPAFNSAPAGTFDPTPQNRGQITAVIANLILPGTVMVTDINKAIEQRNGATKLATMGGGTLTASKEGGKTVTYYLLDKGHSEPYHEEVCGGGKKEGTVTGVVVEKDGKKYIAPKKVEYAKK